MCTEYTADCPVCGKEYLVYVAFCPYYHPPLFFCVYAAVERDEMREGHCPSPVCPNSLRGGCQLM